MRKCSFVFFLFGLGPAWAETWLITIRGPVTVQGQDRSFEIRDEFKAEVVQDQGETLVIRPLVYVHQDFIAKDGQLKADDVNLRVGSFPEMSNPVAGSASRGDRVQPLWRYGDWVLGYFPRLATFRVKKPRWTHVPQTVETTRVAPSVDQATLAKLTGLKTPGGLRFPFVLLPTAVPQGYQATLTRFDDDDRFGPAYDLTYKKGESNFVINLTGGGIGDRWFEEPAKQFEVSHPLLGGGMVVYLDHQTPRWSTSWMRVPGVLTANGDRYRGGYFGIWFSPDFSPEQIRQVLASVKAYQP